MVNLSSGMCACVPVGTTPPGIPVRTVSGRPSLQGVGNYMQQSGALSTSDLFSRTPSAGLGCGCRGLGCLCNGLKGLFDGSGLFGSGLFSSGMDYTQWGIGEYAALAVGGYVLMSVFSTTKRTASVVRRNPPLADFVNQDLGKEL